MNYPILMADIVESRKKDSTLLMSNFKTLVDKINNQWKNQLTSPLTITLGDEFQGIINTMGNAIEIIFQIEEEIIQNEWGFKLRFVLNYGEIETPINKKNAYEMLGDGLTESREKLNQSKSNKNRFIIMLNNNLKAQQILSDLFLIYQFYIDSWKINDYYIVKEFLLNKSYQEVAEALNLNVSSAWRRYKSLNIEEYTTCKRLFTNFNTVLNV
ncbi:SatD family protein [Brumimicrobium oceani]|uniref:SatD family (SatD) n=1 Tax=Brumimicrobium oceani TaxID=2100725 RepID=A0A2U2XER3_9FLAO|nr:SatD family protein [Brumimicrobium oceani]PWH86284.1 hypothetical protein DIT68_03330 [Brumimicrobium oceani]